MLSFFPQGVLDEILNLIETDSEGFPSYSLTFDIALFLNNEAAQLYTGVAFSGSYVKSGKLVGNGITAVYIQNIHEDELLVKMKIDELHDGKPHIISDSTYIRIRTLARLCGCVG